MNYKRYNKDLDLEVAKNKAIQSAHITTFNMHAAICFLLTYFDIFGVKMFLTRVDSVIRYLILEILVHHSGFRDL